MSIINNVSDNVIINNPNRSGYFRGYYSSFYPIVFDNSGNKYYHYYPFYNHFYDNTTSFYDNKTSGFTFDVNPNISIQGRLNTVCIEDKKIIKEKVLEYNTTQKIPKYKQWTMIVNGTIKNCYPVIQTTDNGNGNGNDNGNGVGEEPQPPPYSYFVINNSALLNYVNNSPADDIINWSISSTYDMSKIVVCFYNSFIFESQNFGLDWNVLSTEKRWSCIASSKYGSLYIAGVYGSHVYVSTDTTHNNWIIKESSPEINWIDIKISGNDNVIVGAGANSPLYISKNKGDTWIQKNTSKNWSKVSISYYGNIIVGVVYNGHIYISIDGGNVWTQELIPKKWTSVSISDDAKIMCIVAEDDYIYISKNYGNIWTTHLDDTPRKWKDVKVSSDGSIITALNYDGYIYLSKNYGNTWTYFSTQNSWVRNTMSYDGTKLVTCVYKNIVGTKNINLITHQNYL